MSEENLAKAKLWRTAFEHAADGHNQARDFYKQALLRFRERAEQLLSLIVRDMQGYTVHDINHIDALWDTASVIAGEGYDLNPAEGFVLGGSILLHDAGMTLAAYPRGTEDLRRLPEWRDNLAALRIAFGMDQQLSEEECLTNDELRTALVLSTLRDRHADAATRLAKQGWPGTAEGEFEHLIADSDLRHFYGDSIGRIAASHHWDTEKLALELSAPLGAYQSYPGDWTVDKVKIAHLLRCADAAQIDRRRAPRLLFALTRPSGLSGDHWRFQEKISRPIVRDGRLIYTSTSDFQVEESDAWQIAFDTIQMISRELQSAQEVFAQRGIPPFAAHSAEGARSPLHLANFIRVSGWTPVPTEIQVSDVAHLARSLGGRDLYEHEFSPLREILQNAADAIDARAAMDPEFTTDQGSIVVRLTPIAGTKDMNIEVSDNGIGMSERVMVGPLLDFGKSFWKSGLARSEYPGLLSSFGEPRGRFGIGFFAAFMWADEVGVVSRPFHAALSETKVLEFRHGLNRRPILRTAFQDERSASTTTKVRLRVRAADIQRLFSRTGSLRALQLYHYKDWRTLVALLSALLRTKVYFQDEHGKVLVNIPDWQTVEGRAFVNFFQQFCGPINDDGGLSSRLSLVQQADHAIGRAALLLSPNDQGYRSTTLFVYERGIFVTVEGNGGVFGAVLGKARNAARESADFRRPQEVSSWIEEQRDKVFLSARHIGDEIAAQQALANLGTLHPDRKAFVFNREFLSLTELTEKVSSRGVFSVHFRDGGYGVEGFEFSRLGAIHPIVGMNITEHQVHFLIDAVQAKGAPAADRFGEDFDIEGYVSSPPPRGKLLASIFSRLLQAVGPGRQIEKVIEDEDGYARAKRMLITVKRPEQLQ